MESTVLIDKLLKGSIAAVLRVGLAIPLYLILIPFTLSRLGTDMFAIWSLSTIMIGLVNLTDFGFKNSLVRFVAGNLGRYDEIRNYFNAAFWVYTAISIIILLITMVFADAIVSRLLRVHEGYHGVGVFVLMVSAVSFSIRFIATPFQAVIEGYQEHFYSQLVSLIWLVVNFIGTIISLTITPDVRVLGVVAIATNLLFPLLFIYRVRKKFSFLKLNYGAINMEALISLLKYGAGIQVALIVITLREPIYKVLILRTYDLENLAYFDIAYKLCTQLISIVISPLGGIFSASALLYNREEELGKILRQMIGFTLFVFVPSVLFFGSFSSKIMSAWLGRQADETAFMVLLIYTAFAIYYSTETLYKSIEGSGFSRYSAFVQLIGMTLSIASFMILSRYGTIAIPVSILVGFVAFSLSNYIMFKRIFKNIILLNSRQVLLIIIPAVLYVLLSLIISRSWLPAVFSAYIVIHIVVTIKYKVFDIYAISSRVMYSIQSSVKNFNNGVKATQE